MSRLKHLVNSRQLSLVVLFSVQGQTVAITLLPILISEQNKENIAQNDHNSISGCLNLTSVVYTFSCKKTYLL